MTPGVFVLTNVTILEEGLLLCLFIQGLLDTLPEPGTEWSEEQQKDWLALAAEIFKLLYKSHPTNETIFVTSRK